MKVICNDKVVWSCFFVYIHSDMMRSCLWNFCVNGSFCTIPYSFQVFFIGFKVCFEVIFFVKMIQSYYFISVAFKFLMKNILMGGAGSLAKLFAQFIFYIHRFKNARRHPQVWGIPFDLSLRGWKWRIFII